MINLINSLLIVNAWKQYTVLTRASRYKQQVFEDHLNDVDTYKQINFDRRGAIL
jgi:hypothetical protein